jgi:hypothetical protein
MDETTKAHWLARLKEWAGIEHEVTPEGLKRMVEVAERWREEDIVHAHESYLEQLRLIFQLGIEAGLLKEGEACPWQKYTVATYDNMVDLYPPEKQSS